MTSPIVADIEITVKNNFSELQSNPATNEYFFVYNINIQNNSDYQVQLLSRKWFIFDSNTEMREVEGEGVVGVQPILSPNESYNYFSGCLLNTGFGKMWGYYTFIRIADGHVFDVPIPEFQMVLPWLKN